MGETSREPIGHLVILVHGINTRALWMDEVKPALSDAGLLVESTSYGEYNPIRFLLPGQFLRRKAIDRVVTDINTAIRLHRPECLSVISHSFGTFVIARVLADHPEFKWHRIIFCGSVVPENFPLFQYTDRFDPPLINEIGTKDFWPALAECTGWGYGSVGSTGFNRPGVESRWHNGFRHSDFLTRQFAETYWVPFLKGERPKRGDPPQQLPLWIRAITVLPLNFITAGIVTLALALGLLFEFQQTNPFNKWNRPIVEEPIPPHRDPGAKLSQEPEPRRQAFSYANGDGGKGTTWSKHLAEGGITYWAEQYQDGREPSRFVVDHRIAWDELCDGTVVVKDVDKSFQLFVPDNSAACSRYELGWRTGSYDRWKSIGLIAEMAPRLK
jgi:pimeloyl-ACP methyl ester carboxylesterase